MGKTREYLSWLEDDEITHVINLSHKSFVREVFMRLAAARKRIAELENKVDWLKECRKTNREHIAELRKRLETDANTSS